MSIGRGAGQKSLRQRRKSGRQENVGTKFQSYNSEERSSDSRSRGTQRGVYTHTCTFTRTAEPILSPILYPSPPVYIFPRDGRRPMSHSTPLKCPRKSFSSPLANVFPPTFSRGPAFFQAFRAGIPPGYRTGRSSTIIIIAGFNRVTPIFTSHRNRPRTYT